MNDYSIRKDKIKLRKISLENRDSQNIANIQEKSKEIKEKLFSLSEFEDANNIMFFVSFRSEVMTDFMIREALTIGKKIIVPRVEKHSKTLRTYYLSDFYTDLTFGAYGILEPKADQCKHAKSKDIDLVIVPGAAFSEKGDRIGYGSGYYDRFFETVSDNAKKVALAFELQMVGDVPTSENDIKMDMIITEKRIIRCGE